MDVSQSLVGGEATVVRKAHSIQADQAVLRATITITRAVTGKIEDYELIGTPVGNQEEHDKWL